MINITGAKAFGEQQNEALYTVSVNEKKVGDVNAVYVDASFDFPLDSELAVVIDFAPIGVKRWMADFRHKEFWCRPIFGKRFSDIPDQTQALICKMTDGSYITILPVVSEQYKCILCGTQMEQIQAQLFSWYEKLNSCSALAFVWAQGENPYELMHKCAAAAVELLGNRCKLREERKYPEIFEYLGWCSWDAFQIRIDEKGVVDKCKEFVDKKVPVKWAVLDDMWAEVHQFYGATYKESADMFELMYRSKLFAFRADPIRFPNDLKGCIEKVNDLGIKVGVWHPTTGYWLGIDEQGDIYKEYKDVLIKPNPDIIIPSYERDKAYKYYSAFHDFLKESGAEFVKIDNQSMSRRFYKKYAPVGDVARQFHDAMEQSVNEHFDGQMINCMGMANEDMWNRSDSPVSRCSDDFKPENREWFTKHILQCSYNCVVQGQFYYCDWDMWWTDDGQAVKNSVLRAISGGPIYISDKLDRTKLEILEPLMFKDGRILRCENPAVPTLDCLMKNPKKSSRAFKLQNLTNGCGILAAFNLNADNYSVNCKVSPKYVLGLEGKEFAVYEYFSREMKILKAKESFTVPLSDNDDFKLFIIVPLDKDGNGFIGRIDKMNAPKSFIRKENGECELIEDGPYAKVVNRELVIIK